MGRRKTDSVPAMALHKSGASTLTDSLPSVHLLGTEHCRPLAKLSRPDYHARTNQDVFLLRRCGIGVGGRRPVARDWPQWGGTATRNMFSLERGIPASFDPGKRGSDGSGIDLSTSQNVRWAARLGSENYSSPAIAGGKVFIGTNDSDLADPRFQQTGGGVLLCLDEATGRLLWRLVVPRLTTGRKSSDFDDMDLGICSSPAVDGNRVYVVTNRNEVLCLDANGMANGNDGPFFDERHYEVPAGHPPVEPGPQDADIIWRFDLNALPVFPHDAAASSVLVFGDVLFVGTGNGVDNKTHPMPSAPS